MRRLARGRRGDVHELVFLVQHDSSHERDAINERHERWAELDAGRAAAAARRHRRARTRQRPYTTADFDLYMRALLHAIRVMGVDHVGLGADWDGGGGVIGMEDIAAAAADHRPAAARGL